MKTKILLLILALGLFISVLGQNTIELTFTAIDSADYEQLDSIKVMNRTQGGDTVLYYPDTTLVLDYQVGISETNIGTKGFQVFQNYPNPVVDKTTISFYVPERDKVSLIVTDMLGRVVIKTERTLNQGNHSYLFTPGNGNLFLFKIQWRESTRGIKILKTNSISNNESKLEYIGIVNSSTGFKETEDIQSFLFNLGDELLYIGYIDTLESGMLDTPEISDTLTYQFATNIPCPGMPIVEYEGQVYNTIQVFSQCWLKENLNVGAMIQGNMNMADNDTIEKYCYNNEPDSCIKYGGIYQWNELMQYTTQEGAKGICPPGWHIPTEEEYNVLEGAADSQYGIGSAEWEIYLWRGYDSGKNLKTTSGWAYGGNGTDALGFSCLPAGMRTNVSFIWINTDGGWFTSTERNSSTIWGRHITYTKDRSGRGYRTKNFATSVRCIKNH